MAPADETRDQSWHPSARRADAGPPVPGLLLVFSGRRPALRAIRLERPTTLGRDAEADLVIDDASMSRRHVEVAWGEQGLVARDLGSRNGTFVDGAPLGDETPAGARLLRAGDSLLLPCPDVRALEDAAIVIADGVVVGPTLRAAYDEIRAAAAAGDGLHLTGESGVGKELAARHYHDSGPRAAGSFVAVNCAALPAALAERLLFGARRGAYSGATDSDGYLQAAAGGTLFLDEIAELAAEVQAKLLRALESGEVVPLGAAEPVTVAFGLCSATHADLRALAGAGRFRDDLYFRIGRPAVALPPLRERREEIPWLLQRAIGEAAPGVALHASLVEAALLRPWPGNVRELLTEAADAARRARAAGAPRATAEHLAADAGQPLAGPDAAAAPPVATPGLSVMERNERDLITAALARHAGDADAAARELGLSRATVYRRIAKYKI